MTPPPSGTVTFLLADIQGSVQPWEHAPADVRDILDRQRRLLQAMVQRHQGYVFPAPSAWAGAQATWAAFGRAADGLAAVVETRRALAQEGDQASGPLRTRMALHTGAAESRGDGYVGPSIDRVSRLLAAGHGGQVLLSQPTADLVRVDLPPDISLRDLGEQRFRDSIRSERVFQLVIGGQPADFPPLQTLDTRPNNLPMQATRLIGREHEMAEIHQRLSLPHVRLLTLTGPGGIGKTRLALQVAAELLDDYRDGVFFVPLGQLSETSVIASTIAKALGVPDMAERPAREQRPPWESVREHLRERQLLLLLDNFEHLLSEASPVADLLTVAPRLNVLITSRAALRVYGEHTYPVPPLSLPEMEAPPLDELARCESVRLFVERARAVKPDFAMTRESAPAVAAICQRLDGLPLAIELAAARSRLLPPQTMLSRLVGNHGDTLQLLTGGARDRPRRQQTLRDAIAWSYDLLSPAEQALFRQLGVFVGGCSLEALERTSVQQTSRPADEFKADEQTSRPADQFEADAHGRGSATPLLGGGQSSPSRGEPLARPQTPNPSAHDSSAHDSPADLLDLVTSLVDKSLVHQVEVDGEPRFVMLETIREFAIERLVIAGEFVEARRRHTACFLEFAEHAEPLLRGEGQIAWLGRLSTDHDNLRAALGWSGSRTEDAEIHVRLANALAWFWYVSGHFDEGWRWMNGAAQLRVGVAPGLRTRILSFAGVMAFLRGDHGTARAYLNESLALARDLDDDASIGYALLWLSSLDVAQGQNDCATTQLDESLGRFQRLADDWGMGWALVDLGLASRARGDRATALTHLRDGLAAFRRIGDTWGIAWSLSHLAVALRDDGDRETASRRQEEALALFRELGDGWGTGWALYNLGTIRAGQGDQQGAVVSLTESVELRRRLGDRRGLARSLQALGTVQHQAGDLAAAGERYRECARLRHAQGDRSGLAGLAEALEGLANIAAEHAHGIRAARLLGAAEALRAASGGRLPGPARLLHDRTGAALSTLLATAERELEQAVGAALTPEEALDLALGDDEPARR